MLIHLSFFIKKREVMFPLFFSNNNNIFLFCFFAGSLFGLFYFAASISKLTFGQKSTC